MNRLKILFLMIMVVRMDEFPTTIFCGSVYCEFLITKGDYIIYDQLSLYQLDKFLHPFRIANPKH